MDNNKIVHAFSDDVLSNHDGLALARLIASKALQPAEVIEAAIVRARRVEPELNAIAFNCFSQALEQAEHTARNMAPSVFAGVPTFVKDNTPVAGLPTQYGCDAFRAGPESKTGPYARQYLAQGFTLLGKSALPEFGLNATTEPAHRQVTPNPWNTDYSAGASSGGAAALVAAGVVPIAHANDGGGSIRIPAACCGLIGLKPSRGRHLNSDHARFLPINIVSEGVVSRSVRDTAYFHAGAETYYRNKKLPPIGLVERPNKKRLRIAVVTQSISGTQIDSHTLKAVEKTANELSDLGHYVEFAALPVKSTFAEDFGLYWAMLAYTLQLSGRATINRNFDARRLDGLTMGLGHYFKRHVHLMPGAFKRLKQGGRQYLAMFERYDVLLMPVLSHTTPELGYINPQTPFDVLKDRLSAYVGFTPLANVSGGPAISLPACLTEHHLPVSIQLAANVGRERTLLELAYELEQARFWTEKPLWQ